MTIFFHIIQDHVFSERVFGFRLRYITSLIRKDLPEWKTFTEDEIMELGSNAGMIHDRYHDIYQILD